MESLDGGSVGKEGGEVVIEGEDAGVRRVVHASGARVAGAKVAGGVVGEPLGGGGRGGLALPRALGALGGDQDPFAEEGVVAAVGDQVEGAWGSGHGGLVPPTDVDAISVWDRCL